MNELRLAIVGAPRTGNCYLRHMLAQLLELEEVIRHLPEEVPWDHLPARAILQLHWLPDAAFTAQLAQHDFRVVVNCRHPLDVLVSILAFAQHDKSTLRWLGGSVHDERTLQGASPVSKSFLDYATGPRAESLLGVSAQWWQLPGTCRVRYEELLLDPASQLERICEALEVEPRRLPAVVAGESTPDRVRQHNVHMLYHVWHAQSGLWKHFIPAEQARRICEVHARVMILQGYGCDPDEALTIEAAQAAWEKFDYAALKRNVFGVKEQIAEIHARHHHTVSSLQTQLHDQQQRIVQLEEQGREVDHLRRVCSSLERQLAELPINVLHELKQLGPWSLGTAQRLNHLSGRYPRAAAGFKNMVRLFRGSPENDAA